MDENYSTYLFKSDFFRDKSHREIQDIIHRTDYRINRFKRGSLIVQMGEVFPFMGIVLSGSVEVHRPLMTGHTVCIKYISVNAMFGGAVAFSDKETRYPCDIIGRNPGELFLLPRKDAVCLAETDPVIAKNMLNIFSNRVLDYKQRVELLAYSSIRQKIACYLTLRSKAEQSLKISLPFTKAKWAEYLHVSRPSLMRELKVLEDRKLIHVNDKKISLTDHNGLEAVLYY